MHNYDSMKHKHAKRVCQTIDTPILIFDYFELGEIMLSLAAMLGFGIFFNSWMLMFLSVVLILGVGPVVRRRNNKGVFLHYPYRKFGMNLPGMINPGSDGRYSD